MPGAGATARIPLWDAADNKIQEEDVADIKGKHGLPSEVTKTLPAFNAITAAGLTGNKKPLFSGENVPARYRPVKCRICDILLVATNLGYGPDFPDQATTAKAVQQDLAAE